uniref:Gag protein n=1 Tax=Sarcophilus harrisii TaxID=9305 RepID=A0A7N4P388_SARHA
MGQMLGKGSPSPPPTPSATPTSGAIESMLKLIEGQGLLITWEQIARLLGTLNRTSPWFIEEEQISRDNWTLIGQQLSAYYNENGPHSISIEVFYLYNIIQLALRNPIINRRKKKLAKNNQMGKPDIKEEDNEEINDHILTGHGDLSEFQGCGDFSPQEAASAPPQEQVIDSPPSTPPSRMEGGGAVGGAVTAPPLPRQHPTTPMTRLQKGLMKAKAEGIDVAEIQHHIFPVKQQFNFSGQESRRYAPFNVEILKDLKKACTLYGATSAYVKMLLQNLAFEILTPNDWKSIARVCLEPGQNYLWLSEYSELCRIQAQQNSQSAFHAAITYDLLTGVGPYADVTVQINYSIAAYEQIAANAIKAWVSLHNKDDKGEAFTKITQGPNEPFADFVGRLQTAITRTNGENASTDVLIRQLAKENANEVCRRIILGLCKDAPLEEFIRRCATVGTNAFYSQAMMQTSQDPNMGRQSPSGKGLPMRLMSP